ncbi:unnamed protein product [Pleuronectes platessa]|uniref:Uncharacterized protein n=1 Tax=Pleuronectes platessa TaxID=8262 RepID=A0A9N7TXP4_PLEPL|nr:unnamed protein product [Pleuronectes platessa]
MAAHKTSAVLCSGGCALLAVSSLLAIITIFLPSGGCERRICTLAGYMQMAAALIGANFVSHQSKKKNKEEA